MADDVETVGADGARRAEDDDAALARCGHWIEGDGHEPTPGDHVSRPARLVRETGYCSAAGGIAASYLLCHLRLSRLGRNGHFLEPPASTALYNPPWSSSVTHQGAYPSSLLRSLRFAFFLVASLLSGFSLLAADAPIGPLSPREEMATFRVPKGFRVELVASEPDVVDPVAAAFNEDGRLFVAEMRGYPNGGVGTGSSRFRQNQVPAKPR